ncbi:DUF1579 family protein [Parvularcula sp. ZS-1/3]|uniref:DUF1579 family protein n=1 Tax=Parvularcula mediterranea TaxID=2732508 RepID=A0A7Y3RNM1_9PROT|nr:DUF1579 family protein [Parvularcula mediterranea]NNU16935.1 DUF1579 family protein [Parvularcula mediterranea]
MGMFLSALLLSSASPCAAEVYRQFDFWVGTWDIYAGDQLAGRSEIAVIENGCAIEQRWTSATGATGRSISHYDHADQSWHQTWVGEAFSVLMSGGLDREGAMSLKGTVSAFGQPFTSKYKGRWKPVGDDRIEQRFDFVDPETGEWRLWFEGHSERVQD